MSLNHEDNLPSLNSVKNHWARKVEQTINQINFLQFNIFHRPPQLLFPPHPFSSELMSFDNGLRLLSKSKYPNPVEFLLLHHLHRFLFLQYLRGQRIGAAKFVQHPCPWRVRVPEPDDDGHSSSNKWEANGKGQPTVKLFIQWMSSRINGKLFCDKRNQPVIDSSCPFHPLNTGREERTRWDSWLWIKLLIDLLLLDWWVS